MGWECGTNNTQLCRKPTYSEAFAFLEHHLTVSSGHATLSGEERNNLLQTAYIWEENAKPPSRPKPLSRYHLEEHDDDSENDDDGDEAAPEDSGVGSAASSMKAAYTTAAIRMHQGSHTRSNRQGRPTRIRDRSRSCDSRAHNGTIAARPTQSTPTPPPPPLRLEISPTSHNATLRNALESLRRTETDMTRAAQIAVFASTVLATETTNVARNIAALEEYLACV